MMDDQTHLRFLEAKTWIERVENNETAMITGLYNAVKALIDVMEDDA